MDLTGQGEGGGVTIKLETEPAHHISGFIFGNRLCTKCVSVLPPFGCECDEPSPIPYIGLDAEGTKRGKSLLICGAGPSLSENASHTFATHVGDVWAANSALNWCLDNGYPVTHGLAIDASQRMFGEVWTDPPAMDYILATSVNPGLTSRILKAGGRVTQFHSVRAAPDEFQLYQSIYPPMFIAGRGLNVVNRATELAAWLGYARIKLLGVDHAYTGGMRYADGRGPGDGDCITRLNLDGREWVTNPDMLYCATSLVNFRNEIGRTRLRFVGDVLPKALQDKSQEFLEKRVIGWAPKETPKDDG